MDSRTVRVRDGAKVHARFSYRFGGFSPVHQTLSLSVDDQVAFHYAAAGAVSELDRPKGWKVQQTDALCTRDDGCGKWADYAVSVVSPDAASASLHAGQSGALAGFSVVAGSQQQLPRTQSPCSDWFVSESELLVQRSQPLGPVAAPCNARLKSTLPGVELRFDNSTVCSFTLAQARAGIRIPYQFIVANDVPGVRSFAQDAGGCTVQPAGQLSLFEELSGNGQYYALADVGGCGGSMLGPVGTVRHGTLTREFTWDGVNWYGPSDTSQPKGKPFSAGLYTLTVRAQGVYGAADGGEPDAGDGTPFELFASMDVLLTDE